MYEDSLLNFKFFYILQLNLRLQINVDLTPHDEKGKCACACGNTLPDDDSMKSHPTCKTIFTSSFTKLT